MAEQTGISIRYTPRASSLARDTRDLLMLEQQEWGPYLGVLTRLHFARYLSAVLYGGELEEEPVDCGWGADGLAITIYAYPLAPGVHYRLASTVGQIEELEQESITERQTVSFGLERSASLPRPAVRILASDWLTGPYTTGGARVAPPALRVSGLEVLSPIPVFGSVWLTLEVQRASAIIRIERDEAEPLLAAGWSEFVVGMPSGGRPVALEITPPPGAEEMAKLGLPCGRGGGRASITWPDEDEITAPPYNKHVRCDYCKLECEEEGHG